jgi:light-regulated signal transduction histidine kinase (bacteriophytochrome)
MAEIDLQVQDINLNRLKQEPIHICGKIQQHGVLFVLEEPELKIVQVSKNTSTVFGISPENMVQKNLEDLLDTFQVEKLKAGLSDGNLDFINPTKVWVRKKGVRLDLEAHSTYQESSFMSIYKLFESMTQYISEAVVRIFSPNDDAYPIIGVQPFSGEPFQETKRTDW